MARPKHNRVGHLLERFSAIVTRWTGGTSAFAVACRKGLAVQLKLNELVAAMLGRATG